MTGESSTSRADRLTIDSFLASYCKALGINVEAIRYPEDDSHTPPDARIDAICCAGTYDIHIEHSSVDLIVSGSKNKRSLDPGFITLEQVLKQITCPPKRGVKVFLRLEYAKNIPALKSIAPELKTKIENYLKETDAAEWQKYPRISDVLLVDRFEFQIRPDILHSSNVSLQWLGSDDNFLGAEELQQSIEDLVRSKLAKIDRSIVQSSRPRFGLLLIETNDAAAQSFHAFCGVFARVIAGLKTSCSEVWGYRDRTDPTLIWFDHVDVGRNDCVYTDDRSNRSWAQIEAHRMHIWKSSRCKWVQNVRDGRNISGGPLSNTQEEAGA